MAFERISLNIIPDGKMPVFHASQFDAGRPIIIDLYNGDDAYTPASGVTFELHCRKVDDNIVTLDTYEVDGNTITFTSTEQLCACSGDNLCEVAIMHDDLLMGTLNFILHVERDPLAGGLTSETSIYNLTEQIDDIISGEGYVKDTDLEVLQSDWNETDVSSPAYIKNKPGPALSEQSDWTETDPLKQSYIKHKPTIPTKTSELTNDSGFVESSDLAAVATSGDYDDLLNKPSIPAAQVQSDWYQTNSGAVDYIKNKPYVPLYTENETPYQYRPTPLTANRTLEKLIGCSCAFNQLVNTGDTSINTTSGRKYLTKINNVWSIIQGGSAVSINDSSVDMVIDLTALFGSEVADYFYNLEAQTAGAGVAKFRQLFPESYYAYQTATLISAKPVSKKIYDSSNNVIAEYPLGSDEIRGLLKVENGELVAYGDIHNSDGTGAKYFGIVDLGSLDWTYTAGIFYTDNIADKKVYNSAYTEVFLSDLYTSIPNNTSISSMSDMSIKGQVSDIRVYIKNSNYSNAATFKTAMSGKYLIYELQTPVSTTYTAFSNPMLCGSTEEFTDSRSVKMPCGHDSLYYSSPFKGW